MRTLYGCSAPFALRRSEKYVPDSTLEYSSRSTASYTPAVPKFTAIIGSTPAAAAHFMNSSTPTVFGSVECQARSRRAGRAATGPMPSRHRYPETKLPPG
jgi:hypothetical protein